MTPTSGAARALTAANSTVDLLMLDSCCERVSSKVPGKKQCFEAPSVANFYEMKDESQIRLITRLSEHMADNLTYLAFKETSKL